MKHNKLMLPATAIAVAMVLALAMKPAPKQQTGNKFDAAWFNHNSGALDDVESYSPSGGLPNCSGSDTVCAVFVEPDETGDHPDQQALQDIQQDIQDALQQGQGTTEIKLKN